MSWAIFRIILLVISVVGFLTYLIFLFRFIRLESQRLKLSDRLGITGSVMNAIVLIIAMSSLIIAIDSYESANKSGAEQLRALEASRVALNSVAKNTEAQQQLLTKSLITSEKQLTISNEQRQRELQRPDVNAEILKYPSNLGVKFNNVTNKVARDFNYQLTLISQDQLDNDGHFKMFSTGKRNGSGAGFLPTPFDFGSAGPNYSARLFGYLTVECPQCETQKRIYWLSYENHEGWYHEGTDKDYPYPISTYKPAMRVHEIIEKFKKRPNKLKIYPF